jgi:assimilatory nitrate reductase catalytic subunit
MTTPPIVSAHQPEPAHEVEQVNPASKTKRFPSLRDGFLHKRNGGLTQELVRSPGGFGLGQVPQRLAPEQTTSMVCGYCSVGCSLEVHLQQGQAVNLTPDRHYPVNLGMACPKGWEALTPLRADDRLLTPLLRDATGKQVPIDWPTATRTFAERFKDIQSRHGNDSVAFISTGQIPTEEMALLGAFAKFGMGVVHGDGNTRQCMATSVVAYKQSFGFDAPPYTYDDFEHSDVIVLLGSNLCIAHPILWERICRNQNSPEIVVVDPRVTETASAATQHYALTPKSDLTLLYGIAHILIANEWIDHNYIDRHTSQFNDFAQHVQSFDPELVSAATGLSVEQLYRFAKTIHEGKRVSFWWTMGINQSHQGVRSAQAVINLALMTGNIGRPGTGANSITGQCNAMGSRLFSNTTNLFGGRDFANEQDRTDVANILGIEPHQIPAQPSLAYDQIIEKILSGKIKGLWIIATNTAHSWINQEHVKDVLDRLEFLVVQDMYSTTETVAMADLVLPAAGWGEKEGTFINSERRFGLLKRVSRAPGQALADFSIFKLLADAWGCADMFHEWDSPEDTFHILKRLSQGRPCDFTGIDGYETIDANGGIQWPFPNGSVPEFGTQRRLFEDGLFHTNDGRARFIFDDASPVREPVSDEYPLVMLSGRGSSAQWHTLTRTSKSPLLRSLAASTSYVELSPLDACARNISANEVVEIVSRRGTISASAFITTTVKPGQIFIPMHDPATNKLTCSSFDPHSRQPSYKHCAVEVRKHQ